VAKRIYFVAGEASGDAHGAALVARLRELDPALECIGRGGPRMAAFEGPPLRDWIAGAAVVGLWEVVTHYRFFRREFSAALDEIGSARPDAVVLIDYPGFNLRLARALRRRGDRCKIIYYISPQVWAWNRRRIPQMARYLDLMLCIFPFEAQLYNASGLRTKFVGHPMIKSLEAERGEFVRDENLIGLFPGSRSREVRQILPVLLETAELIGREHAGARFEIAAASADLASQIEAALPAASHYVVNTGRATSLMQRASLGLVASGSATLEAAYFRLPFLLVYKVAWLTYLAARAVVQVPHLAMPNVLAGREIIPEYIQHRAQPAAIARSALRLLRDPDARAQLVAAFDEVIAMLSEEDASREAAAAIMAELKSS
jgi:lipid-A-disaccharide synthase